MSISQYQKINKSSWPEGPWMQEPDEVKWIDEDTGYECEIYRNALNGFLAGYVVVTKSHPLFKVDYSPSNELSRKLQEIDVHTGITSLGSSKKHGDDKWLLGFNCCQDGDLSPNLRSFVPSDNYKDIEYVTSEVESLAKQLKDLEA